MLQRIIYTVIFSMILFSAKSQFIPPVDRLNSEYHYDTIHVMLMVSDKSDSTGKVSVINAYEVRKVTIEKMGSYQYRDIMWYTGEDKLYYDTETYLDKSMNPLPNSIIVWQSYRINQ